MHKILQKGERDDSATIKFKIAMMFKRMTGNQNSQIKINQSFNQIEVLPRSSQETQKTDN